jgi:uncharacterized membrane protein
MFLNIIKQFLMNNWIEYLLPIIKEFKNGNDEPLDGDDVDKLTKIIKTEINFHEGNITEEEYNKFQNVFGLLV